MIYNNISKGMKMISNKIKIYKIIVNLKYILKAINKIPKNKQLIHPLTRISLITAHKLRKIYYCLY